MAKSERVHACDAPGCKEYVVEGRGDPVGWQVVSVRPLIDDYAATGVRSEKRALCPLHALRSGVEA